jgi:hypothetical protein
VAADGPQPIDNAETCSNSKRLTRVQAPETVPRHEP